MNDGNCNCIPPNIRATDIYAKLCVCRWLCRHDIESEKAPPLTATAKDMYGFFLHHTSQWCIRYRFVQQSGVIWIPRHWHILLISHNDWRLFYVKWITHTKARLAHTLVVLYMINAQTNVVIKYISVGILVRSFSALFMSCLVRALHKRRQTLDKSNVMTRDLWTATRNGKWKP